MQELENLGAKGLIRQLMLSISVIVFIFAFVVLVSISVARADAQQKREQVYNTQVQMSMEHAIKHFIRDYTYRARRVVETTPIAEYIKRGDREEVYKLLHKKYELMQEETPGFKIMHVHLADGTSFLRVHQADKFGDNIAKKRPMLQAIHQNHKLIHGYETGIFGTAYRVIAPIFDAKGVYIGAFEIGLNPNFIIEAIYEINGFRGAVFIKNEELKLYSTPSDMQMDSYTLQTKLDENTLKICKAFQTYKNFNSNTIVKVEGKSYLIHLLTLKNFKGEESVKLLVFQDFTKANPFFNKRQLLMYFGLFVVLILLMWIIYTRVKKYHLELLSIYNEYILEIEEKERALEESKEYHKALFKTIPEILVATNGKEIVDANDSMLEFFGYATLDEFREEHECICDLFLEEEGYLFKEIDGLSWLEYIKHNPKRLHKVSMLNSKQKHHFWVRAQELKYDAKSRELVSFVDITELEELNSRLEMAIEGTNAGVWDWNLVSDELYLSPQWKKQLGYEDGELKNTLETWKSHVHPDDLESAVAGYTANMEGKSSYYENIHRLRHKDGSWVWILDRGKTQFDKNGKAIRMVGFHTDITKQKSLEAQLRETTQLFNGFMEYIPAYIYIKDETQRFVYTNKLGYSFFRGEDIIGKDSYDLLSEENLENALAIDREIEEKGSIDRVFKFFNGEDKPGYYRVLGFLINENENKKIGVVIVDISEAHENQEKLKSQEKIMISQSRHAAMGEMISMIAHQWRQPISAIAMDANNVLVDIELGLLENESLQKDLSDIIAQTQHLSATIDDFRDFFKPEKSKELVLIEDVYMDAYRVIEKSFLANSVECKNSFDSQTPVQIFSRELLQVFVNILKNAKEALEENRREHRVIESSITESSEDVIVEICDNARGISEDIIEKIFDPYFSTKSEKNGTGLGLYMSKIIVEKHLLGTLSVANRGEGACFRITIPKKEDKDG